MGFDLFRIAPTGKGSISNYYLPIVSMYGIYANMWGILMVNVTIYIYISIYGIHTDPLGYQPIIYTIEARDGEVRKCH